MLYFVHGDSAGGTVARAHPDARIALTSDVFTEGPCRLDGATDVRQWLSKRAAWWDSQYPSLGYGESHRTTIADLCDELADADGTELVIWLAESASEQLHLCWLSDLLPRMAPSATRLVAKPAVQMKSFVALGALNPDELLDVRIGELAPADVAKGADIWRAYTAPTPTRFSAQSIEARGHPLFGNLYTLLRRFPSATDGLTHWERALLTRLAANEGEKTTLTIAHVLADGWEQTPDFVGDLTLFDRLCELGSQGLLKLEGDGESMRSTSFAMTVVGARVLEGGTNRVSVAGFDRWIGGTQVQSSGQMWWYDGAGVSSAPA